MLAYLVVWTSFKKVCGHLHSEEVTGRRPFYYTNSGKYYVLHIARSIYSTLFPSIYFVVTPAFNLQLLKTLGKYHRTHFWWSKFFCSIYKEGFFVFIFSLMLKPIMRHRFHIFVMAGPIRKILMHENSFRQTNKIYKIFWLVQFPVFIENKYSCIHIFLIVVIFSVKCLFFLKVLLFLNGL